MNLLDSVTIERPTVDIDLAELAAVSAELERKPASSAIKWAWERYGTDIVLAASFQDCVLVDVAAQVIDAVHRDRFWVVSHPGLDATMERRFAEILDACRHGGESGQA